MALEFASLVIPRSGEGQDVIRLEGSLVMLADGAGGTSGGRETAEFVLEALGHRLRDTAITPAALRQAVLEVATETEERAAGQTTLVIAHVNTTRVLGASIGDSQARLLIGDTHQLLTEGQSQKPLLGAGIANVHLFEVEFPRGATLLLCSDGVWKYTTRRFVVPPLDQSLDGAPQAAIDAARLPNGELHDDASVILVRHNHRIPAELEADLARRLAEGSDAPASAALLRWIERFNRSSDGSAIDSFERFEDTLVVRGWDQEVVTQRWHPFLLVWAPREWSFFSKLSGFEGLEWNAKRRPFDFDAQSDWALRVHWP